MARLALSMGRFVGILAFIVLVATVASARPRGGSVPPASKSRHKERRAPPRCDVLSVAGRRLPASFTWWRNAKSKSPKSFVMPEGTGGSSSHSRVLFGVAVDTLVHEAARR